MIDWLLLSKGLGVGVLVAAPVGPVGALCIRRAISIGRTAAIGTGLGAATADAFYGGVAAFGLTAISDFLLDYQMHATFLGGFFLLYLSYRIMSSLRRGTVAAEAGNAFALGPAFVSTFFITLTNPATILSFAAIFAGIGFIGDVEAFDSAIVLVSGVFFGSAAWWVFLAFISHELKKRFGSRFEYLVNIGSAVLIGFFGVAALTSLLF
ncbi:LysE family translocator [Sneathiella limimaris]|uniref:LysE family translocator n=1 Tax=Sneathiella limimaris TaxID=1964213 RepID=UPI00146B8A4F|nr:LysE family transporter [Sneathiella limimaris]